MPSKAKGKCLCGAVEVTATLPHNISLCHCDMCRRWTSGPMFAVHCGSDVEFFGVPPKTFQSSDWAERGFCLHCGSHIYYLYKPNGEYALSSGLFQDVPFTLQREIFIDEKPAYYEFQQDTEKLSAEDVIKLYSADT